MDDDDEGIASLRDRIAAYNLDSSPDRAEGKPLISEVICIMLSSNVNFTTTTTTTTVFSIFTYIKCISKIHVLILSQKWMLM